MRWTRGAVSVLAATLVVSAAGSSRDDTTTSANRSSLVVDTDGGSDDAMALLYLLQHRDIEVAAITVSGTGLVHCPAGAANAAGLVDLVGSSREIPVACGRSAPVEGDRAYPAEWRASADDRYGGVLPAGAPSADATDAVDLLVQTLHHADHPVTVLTLGPLTNLALALDASPDIAEQIDHVVVMGGAFDVPGNVQLSSAPSASIAEWNIYVDPAAAERVLDSGVAVTFVPLDTQVPVDAYVLRDLDRAATTPPARVVAQLLESDPFFASGQFYFWDPLAAAVAAEPTLFTTRAEKVSVVKDGSGAGWTTTGGGTDAAIATVVDGDAFIGSYLATLDGKATPIAVSREPDATITGGDGCAVTPAEVRSGPLVLSVGSTPALIAIGDLEPGRTDEDIEAYLATNPAGPPPWFDVSALLGRDSDAPAATLVDLDPGSVTVVCVGARPNGALVVTGRTSLTATEE